MDNFFNVINKNFIVNDVSNLKKVEKAVKNNKSIYCGFDPTASSLHIGHLPLICLLKKAQECGLKPIVLLGGFTAMIGDPSFKSKERILLRKKQVDNNLRCIKKQLKNIIPDVEIINNNEWWDKVNLLEFLRDIGKEFNINDLINKKTISHRLKNGLSITEFLYPLFQAYDFYNLYKNNNVALQIGGADQWGNITSGLDFIKSKVGKDNEAVGLTTPLLLQDNGEKFGKTSSGDVIWLDEQKTNPYEFYQFWLNQSDEQATTLFKRLTKCNETEMYEFLNKHLSQPNKKILQNRLAFEMTLLVHGEEKLEQAQNITNALFNNDIEFLNDEEWWQMANALKMIDVNSHTTIIETVVENSIVSSRREALEFILGGGITINGKKVNNPDQEIGCFLQEDTKMLLLRKGKKKHFLINLY